MICLVALTGSAPSGCLQPSRVPPEASIGRHSRPAPALTRQIPRSTPSPAMQEPKAAPSVASVWPVSNPRDWEYIVIHHTASESGSVESIDEAHSKRKDGAGNSWLGIGYHFVIGNGNGMPDGEVEPTFRWKQQLQGAHAGVKEYNQQGIGICLVGNFEEQPPSSSQLQAVKSLVSSLRAEFGIRPQNVIGHGDVKATDCPGRYFPLDEVASAEFLRPQLSSINQFRSHHRGPQTAQWASLHGSHAP